jgi:hypothetical protein
MSQSLSRPTSEHLRDLEGQIVRVRLRDGRRWDAELVSAGGRDVHTIWLVVDGRDVLLPLSMIVTIDGRPVPVGERSLGSRPVG